MLQPCPRRSEKAAVENHGAEYIMHDATFIGALSYKIKRSVLLWLLSYWLRGTHHRSKGGMDRMLVSTRRVGNRQMMAITRNMSYHLLYLVS